MALQIIVKNSSVSGKEPTGSQLANGELALNYHADGPFITCKDTNGVVRRITGVWIGTAAPGSPTPGEFWLDTNTTPAQLKVYKDGTDTWVSVITVYAASTATAGVVELATNAETQAGNDTNRAVTPASLQSKLSDSTSTTSSTTIASSTAVKSAKDVADAALPKAGGTMTGTLEIGATATLVFEGSTENDFETVLAVVDPTADRTITLPDVSGTVVTTGDTGTVTSAMLADGTIVDADISASAEIAVSKLADGTARQLLQTDAAGTGVEWTDNVDILGTLDVTSTATFDSIASHPLGTAGAPTITFTGDTNTGIYSPGADQLAISTNGNGRLFVDANGNVGIGAASTGATFRVIGVTGSSIIEANGVDSDGFADIEIKSTGTSGASRLYFSDTAAKSGLIRYSHSANSLEFTTNGTEAARLDSSGRLLVGTSTDSGGALLQVNGDRVRVATAKTPASATATGTTGEVCWDANYVYVCVATNTWKRSAISTW